jgi:chemotaxis family two-component system response regulator Rcp1
MEAGSGSTPGLDKGQSFILQCRTSLFFLWGESMERVSERRVNILIVEDNSLDADLFRMALDSAELHYDLTVVEDGSEALALIRRKGKYADLGIPDLAVLDLNLPKNDGLEILRELRGNALFADMPVAIMTSSASPRERAKIEECGVACYLTKPSDLDECLRIGITMKNLLMESEERSKSRVA